jgi:hypothetical protein
MMAAVSSEEWIQPPKLKTLPLPLVFCVLCFSLIVCAAAQDRSVQCVPYHPSVVSSLAARISSSSSPPDLLAPPRQRAPRSAACSKDFQGLLQATADAIAAAGAAGRRTMGRPGQVVAMRSQILSLDASGNAAVLDRCTLVQQAVPYTVTSGSACCAAEHILSNSSVARVLLLVEAAARRLDSFLNVLFVPDVVPAAVPPTAASICGLSTTARYVLFSDPEANTGIIVTMTPTPQTAVWLDTLAWATPCAVDAASGRPFVIRLNLNPLLVGSLSDDVVTVEVQRQLLHAMGVMATNLTATVESGLNKTVLYWRKGKAVMSSSYSCDAASPANSGLPYDDELFLAQIGELAAGVGARFEPRVVSADIMSAGTGSADVSLATKTFIDVELAPKGIFTAPSPRAILPPRLNITGGFMQAYAPAATLEFVGKTFTSSAQVVYTDPARAGMARAGCGVLHSLCNTSMGGRDAFCFPPDITPTSEVFSPQAFANLSVACTPDMLGLSKCDITANYAAASLLLPQAAIPRIFQYFANASMGGGESDADFCPQRLQYTACSSAVQQMSSGSTFGPSSRCMVASVRDVAGAAPQQGSTPSVGCFAVRCPLGLRLEVLVGGAWTACPLDGSAGAAPIATAAHAGTVQCPAAVSVCQPALCINATEQAFVRVTGYSVEYSLAAPLPSSEQDMTFSSAQAASMCRLVSASLAFLPDRSFAAAVLQAMPTGPSAFRSAQFAWVGATSATTWLDWNGYTMSSVNISATSSASPSCFAMDVAAFAGSGGFTVVVVERPCGDRLPAVCTRPWATEPVYRCPSGTQCHATSLISPSFHRTYIVPTQPLVTRVQAISSICPALSMQLFDFATTDLTTMSQLLSAVALEYGTELQGLWTRLEWDGNVSNSPRWSRLCSNFPAVSSFKRWCFVIVASSTFQPLYAVEDCGAMFPALCFRQNSPSVVARPGQVADLRFFRVPVTRQAAEQVCASYTNGYLAPGFDRSFIAFLLSQSQAVMPASSQTLSAYMQPTDAGRVQFAHIGLVVNTTSGSFAYSNCPNASYGLPSDMPLLPGPGTRFANISEFLAQGAPAFLLTNSTNATSTWWGLGTTAVLGVYACAIARVPSSTGACAAAQVCDDGVSDHTLYMSSEIVNATTAAQQCYDLPLFAAPKNNTRARGIPSWPLFYPTRIMPDLPGLLISQYGYASLTAFWVGLRYSAPERMFYTLRNSSQAAGTRLWVPFLDPTDSALTGGAVFSDGACVALTNPSAPLLTFVLAEVPCAAPLPYLCATPLFLTWPLTFQPYVTTNMALVTLSYLQSLMSFAVVTNQNVTFSDATRLCQAANGDVGFILYGGSPCNLSSFYGNIFDNLTSSEYAREYWVANSGPVCDLASTTVFVSNTFALDSLRYLSIQGNSFVQSPRLTSTTYYSLNPSANNRVLGHNDTSKTLPFICETNTAQLRYATPNFIACGVSGFSILISSPRDSVGNTPWSLATASSRIRLSVVTNVTGQRTTISPSTQYTCPFGTTSTVTVPIATVACSAVAEPVLAYLQPLLTARTGAFQNYVMQHAAGPANIPVYPCLTVATSLPGKEINMSASATVTFRVFLPYVMSNLSVTVQLASSAQFVATVSPSSITFVNQAGFKSNESVVTVTTTDVGGVSGITAAIQGCNLTLACVAGTTVVLANISAFLKSPVSANWSAYDAVASRSTANTPLPMFGRSNAIQGLGIGLSINPFPARYSLQLFARNSTADSSANVTASLLFSPDTFVVTSAGRQSFEVGCSVPGTYDVYATLTLLAAPPGVFLSTVQGTYLIKQMRFFGASPLEISFTPRKTLFFPGDSVVFSVKLFSPIDQLRTVRVSIVSRYVTFPPEHGSTVSFSNGMLDPTSPVTVNGTISTDVSPFVGTVPLNVSTNRVVEATFGVTVTDSGVLGTFPVVFPINQLPPFSVVLVKTVSLVSYPVFMTVGGPSKTVVVWMEQISFAGDVVVDVACTSNTTGETSSVPWTFTSSMATETVVGAGINGNITLSAAPASGWPVILASAVTCRLVITGPVDVSVGYKNFSILVYPRAIGSVAVLRGAATTTLVRPGWTYTLVVRSSINLNFNRPALGIALSSTVVGFNFKAPTLQVLGDVFGGVPTVVYRYSAVFAVDSQTARGVNLCLAVGLNDTEWYGPVCSPVTCCLEVAPLVKLYPVPVPASFLLTQPVGAKSAQSISLCVSSLPRDQPVVATISIVPDRTATGDIIASLSDNVLTWKPERFFADSPALVVLNTSITGYVANHPVNIYVSATGGAEFVAFPSQLFFESQMEFVPMATLDLTIVNFPGLLFVDEANSKQLMVSLSTAPFRDLTVRIVSSPCLSVVPSVLNFTNESGVPLSVVTTITGLCPADLVTLAAEVTTTATNFDSTQNGKSLSFPLLPLQNVTLISQKSGLPIVSVTLYCNDEATSVPVFVNVSRLPTRLDATLALTLSAPKTALYITPSRFAFSRAVSNATFLEGALACPQQFHTSETTATMVVSGPPEFHQGGFSFRATLQPLVTFAVILFPPDYMTVGTTAAYIAVTPNALPLPGTEVSLLLLASCGSAVALQRNGRLAWSSTDVDAEIVVKLVATAASPSCGISLAVDESSSSQIYTPVVFNTTIAIYDPPMIITNDETTPKLISSSDISSGVVLAVIVENNIFSPFPILVASVLDANPLAGVVVSSTISDMAANGFLWAMSTRPGAAVTARGNGTTLEIRLLVPNYAPRQDERLTFSLTRFAMLRNETEITANNTFDVTIAASEDRLASVQQNFVGVAFAFAGAVAIFRGPAVATHGPRIAILLDSGNCPIYNWKSQKQNSLTAFVHPFGQRIGDDEILGMYFGAVIFDILFVLIFFFLHWIIIFLAYAKRLDQRAATDRSIRYSMGLLRFPSFEAFPLLYFAGVITQMAGKVVLYSDDLALRIISGIILFNASVSLIVFLFIRVIKRAGANYTPKNSGPDLKIAALLMKNRGKWSADLNLKGVAENLVAQQQHHLGMYGLFFEEFTESYKAFCVFDVTFTTLLSLVSVYEPQNKDACVQKLSTLTSLFALYAIVVVFCRPYRRHVYNVLFGVISLMEVASISVSLAVSVGGYPWGPRAASISLITIGVILYFKGILDVIFLVWRTVRKNRAAQEALDESMHKFVVLEVEETTLETYLEGAGALQIREDDKGHAEMHSLRPRSELEEMDLI